MSTKPQSSHPASHLLADQVRFVAPKLSSLSKNAVARFVQEVSHFLQASEPEQFQSIPLTEPTVFPASSASIPSAAERLAEVEQMIHAALRESHSHLDGFDPETFAAYWSAARKVTIAANPPSPKSSSGTSMPNFLKDDADTLRRNLKSSKLSHSSSSPHQLDDWDGPSFFDDPPVPEGFHRFILPNIISLIRIMCPTALSSQENLWTYLLSTIAAKDASEARRLLNSLSMKTPGREPLTFYILDLQKAAQRCKNFLNISRPKPLMESFIQGLKPYALKSKLMDEFKMNIIQDIDSLISRTIALNETITHEETNPRFRNAQRRSDFNSISNFRTRTPYPNSNLRNKEPAGEKKSCSFCKKDGHVIEDCFDKSCKKSKHYDPSAPQTKKPYSNPRLPRPTFGNAKDQLEALKTILSLPESNALKVLTLPLSQMTNP
ncbi:hypothetical protein GEMRC1_010253 [Eukaryota sp. GEM-RC1]